jgi:hypothetical protein
MANRYGTPDRGDAERARAARQAAKAAAKAEAAKSRADQVKTLDKWRKCGSH